MFLSLQKDVHLYWSKSEGGKVIEFNGVPFCVARSTLYDCNLGNITTSKNQRLVRCGYRAKIGCAAHIEGSHICYFQSMLSTTDDDSLSKWKLRCRIKREIK